MRSLPVCADKFLGFMDEPIEVSVRFDFGGRDLCRCYFCGQTCLDADCHFVSVD